MESSEQPTKKPLTGQRLRSLAFAYLAKREFSKAQLRLKLLEKDADALEVDALLDELSNQNYQSDERMAGMVVRSNLRQGRGPQRIRQQLQKIKVNAELASEDLAEVDWFAEALATKVKKYGAEVATDPKLKAKQIRFLQYRGYSMDVIFKVIQFDVDHNEDF
jgi:regulatory protein